MDVTDESTIRKMVEFDGEEEYAEAISKVRNERASLFDLELLEEAVFNGTYQRVTKNSGDYVIGYTEKIFTDYPSGINFAFVIKKTEEKMERMRLPEDPEALEDSKFLPETHVLHFCELVPSAEPETLPDFLASILDDFDPELWNDYLNQ